MASPRVTRPTHPPKLHIPKELILADEMTGSSMPRSAWNEVMTKVQPNDTVVAARLDRFSCKFEEGVRIQAELTKQTMVSSPSRSGINTHR